MEKTDITKQLFEDFIVSQDTKNYITLNSFKEETEGIIFFNSLCGELEKNCGKLSFADDYHKYVNYKNLSISIEKQSTEIRLELSKAVGYKRFLITTDLLDSLIPKNRKETYYEIQYAESEHIDYEHKEVQERYKEYYQDLLQICKEITPKEKFCITDLTDYEDYCRYAFLYKNHRLSLGLAAFDSDTPIRFFVTIVNPNYEEKTLETYGYYTFLDTKYYIPKEEAVDYGLIFQTNSIQAQNFGGLGYEIDVHSSLAKDYNLYFCSHTPWFGPFNFSKDLHKALELFIDGIYRIEISMSEGWIRKSKTLFIEQCKNFEITNSKTLDQDFKLWCKKAFDLKYPNQEFAVHSINHYNFDVEEYQINENGFDTNQLIPAVLDFTLISLDAAKKKENFYFDSTIHFSDFKNSKTNFSKNASFIEHIIDWNFFTGNGKVELKYKLKILKKQLWKGVKIPEVFYDNELVIFHVIKSINNHEKVINLTQEYINLVLEHIPKNQLKSLNHEGLNIVEYYEKIHFKKWHSYFLKSKMNS